MHTLKPLLKRKSLWRTISSVAFLLLLSFSTLSQDQTQNRVAPKRAKDESTTIDANASEAQRRVFAASLVISLATEARSYKDLALRPRVLARAADALWEADNATARALFVRAWEAAEAGDAEGATINTKDVPKNVPVAFLISLRKREGNDLRVDVLGLASRRDRALGEQFLAKLKSEIGREPGESKNSSISSDNFSGSEASLKRLLVAKRLLAAGEVAAAIAFAAPALTEVTARSIGFLSELREKDAATADKIFSELLARAESDPIADANTISGLSSYAFTPGFYIVFWPTGNSTWTQPDGPTVAPNLDAALRARFFQVAGNVLLRPVPPPDQDMSSCGRRGRLMVITRLLPLFDQYMPETATVLRAQLTAREGRNIDPANSLLTEGIKPENFSAEVGNIEEQLGRARSSKDRDEIYAAAAARLAPTGNKRAREFADSIEEPQFRSRIRNYVDLELIKFAIRKKDADEVVQLAGAGELTHIQRSWSYTQAARLVFESERERALEFLQKATDEGERMDAGDADASFALINVANQLLAIDHSRAWELLNKTVKFANSAEDFTGDDIQMPSRSMIVTRNGTRFARLPEADFNFSHLLRSLALADLFRSIELAKSFKYDAPRAYATLAIARAVLEKPRATTSKR
ncbi:MAG TPA: hypothetical protein VLB46_07870 [Pyrinomonadaceae bacterium]|nr:hypothetical protein [Pyrinomonadaceae bacterium]